ncbi:hypothetical protein Bbelb_049860 [Branchiostoma belcheri]|nr:hypothetical protein Bbelb_049860 [Branchiostoma belcheri]
MGSPVSPIVVNLYMEKFENKALSTFNDTPPANWFRYVDDTWCRLKKRVAADFFDHINQIDDNIKFTQEPSHDNMLPFLDTKTIVEEDGNLCFEVYRKPTHTDQYLAFDSHHPLEHKLAVIKTLFHRADNIVTSDQAKTDEHRHLRGALAKCGYQNWTFNKALKPSDQSKKTQKCKPLTKKNKANITIPYVQGVSEKLRRIFQNFNIATNFKPHSTLRQRLVHPKDRPHKGTKANVIYRLKCEEPNCNNSYIGETSRPLKVRYKEHCRPSANGYSSAIFHHLQHNQGHSFKLESTDVLDRETRWWERGVKEAIYERMYNPTLNREGGYGSIFPALDIWHSQPRGQTTLKLLSLPDCWRTTRQPPKLRGLGSVEARCSSKSLVSLSECDYTATITAKLIAALSSLEEKAKACQHKDLPTFSAALNEAKVAKYGDAFTDWDSEMRLINSEEHRILRLRRIVSALNVNPSLDLERLAVDYDLDTWDIQELDGAWVDEVLQGLDDHNTSKVPSCSGGDEKKLNTDNRYIRLFEVELNGVRHTNVIAVLFRPSYLMAKDWLESYAKRFGDAMPNSENVYLPQCATKADIKIYREDHWEDNDALKETRIHGHVEEGVLKTKNTTSIKEVAVSCRLQALKDGSLVLNKSTIQTLGTTTVDETQTLLQPRNLYCSHDSQVLNQACCPALVCTLVVPPNSPLFKFNTNSETLFLHNNKETASRRKPEDSLPNTWVETRKEKLTASNFGPAMSCRVEPSKKLHSMLYSNISTEASSKLIQAESWNKIRVVIRKYNVKKVNERNFDRATDEMLIWCPYLSTDVGIAAIKKAIKKNVFICRDKKKTRKEKAMGTYVKGMYKRAGDLA